MKIEKQINEQDKELIKKFLRVLLNSYTRYKEGNLTADEITKYFEADALSFGTMVVKEIEDSKIDMARMSDLIHTIDDAHFLEVIKELQEQVPNIDVSKNLKEIIK